METAKWHPGVSTRLCCIRFTLSFKTEKDAEAKADTTKLITCLNAGRKSEEETQIYLQCNWKKPGKKTINAFYFLLQQKKNMIYHLNTNQNAQPYCMQEKDRSLQASLPQMWWKCDQHTHQQKQLNKAQLLLQLAWPNSIRGER